MGPKSTALIISAVAERLTVSFRTSSEIGQRTNPASLIGPSTLMAKGSVKEVSLCSMDESALSDDDIETAMQKYSCDVIDMESRIIALTINSKILIDKLDVNFVYFNKANNSFVARLR